MGSTIWDNTLMLVALINLNKKFVKYSVMFFSYFFLLVVHSVNCSRIIDTKVVMLFKDEMNARNAYFCYQDPLL